MASKCFNCGVSSEEKVLLSCEYRGESLYVCVKCLPILIHGTYGIADSHIKRCLSIESHI